MEIMNDVFTSAIWNVKQGKEQEFIRLWTEFANWSKKLDDGAAHLLQDKENPQRFVSVGKWNNEEIIQEWREKAEFKERMEKITNLLSEPTKPRIMKEVARVGELLLV